MNYSFDQRPKIDFEFMAFFYQFDDSSDNIYRKFATIKKNHCSKLHPDLTVIMLNPGSCKHPNPDKIPFKGIGEESAVPVTPDATMHRIKGLLKQIPDLSFIRILNLSDYCEKESKDFFYKLSQNSLPELHTIFHPDRKAELQEFIRGGDRVILACGIDPRAASLLHLAKLHIQSCGGDILNLNYKPYHPLVRKTHKLSTWTDQVRQYI